MYTFDDRGSNSITLKPEGTASVCRHIWSMFSKFSAAGETLLFFPDFRYERRRRQVREHHQFGCEAIGEADAFLDAEVITCLAISEIAGLKNTLLFINSIGCPECRPKYLEVLRAILPTISANFARIAGPFGP